MGRLLNNFNLKEFLLTAAKVIGYIILWNLLFRLIYNILAILVSALLATAILYGLIYGWKNKRFHFYYWKNRFRRNW